MGTLGGVLCSALLVNSLLLLATATPIQNKHVPEEQAELKESRKTKVEYLKPDGQLHEPETIGARFSRAIMSTLEQFQKDHPIQAKILRLISELLLTPKKNDASNDTANVQKRILNTGTRRSGRFIFPEESSSSSNSGYRFRSAPLPRAISGVIQARNEERGTEVLPHRAQRNFYRQAPIITYANFRAIPAPETEIIKASYEQTNHQPQLTSDSSSFQKLQNPMYVAQVNGLRHSRKIPDLWKPMDEQPGQLDSPQQLSWTPQYKYNSQQEGSEWALMEPRENLGRGRGSVQVTSIEANKSELDNTGAMERTEQLSISKPNLMVPKTFKPSTIRSQALIVKDARDGRSLKQIEVQGVKIIVGAKTPEFPRHNYMSHSGNNRLHRALSGPSSSTTSKTTTSRSDSGSNIASTDGTNPAQLFSEKSIQQ